MIGPENTEAPEILKVPLLLIVRFSLPKLIPSLLLGED